MSRRAALACLLTWSCSPDKPSAPLASPAPAAIDAASPTDDAASASMTDAPRGDASRSDTSDALSDVVFPPDAPERDAQAEAAAPSAVTALTLSLPLVPPFAVGVHDYSVRCPSSTNDVAVTMTAAPGSTVALAQPVTTAPLGAGSLSVTLAANEALVMVVTSEASATEYWVRCLPPDFPAFDWTVHADAGSPPAGYYLVGDAYPPATGGGYAIVLDGLGVPVWYAALPTGAAPFDVDSLEPDALSFCPTATVQPPDAARTFDWVDLTSATTVVDGAVGEDADFHELRVLPNGDHLVLATPLALGVDLTGLEGYGANETVTGCEIQEVDGAGNLVWDWQITDHFDAAQDSTFPQAGVVDHRRVVDAFHCNSLDVAANGDLLVSARNMDSVFLVSPADGAVLWKMGGKAYNKDGAPFITVTDDPMGGFHRQHDARLLPDGGVSMFDDETNEVGPSRAVVYALDVTSATATMVWQREGSAAAADMGSFRVLSDGSRVIGWGEGGGGASTFTEVDEAGHALLDFSFSDAAPTYRVVKVPVTELDIGLLRTAVGAP